MLTSSASISFGCSGSLVKLKILAFLLAVKFHWNCFHKHSFCLSVNIMSIVELVHASLYKILKDLLFLDVKGYIMNNTPIGCYSKSLKINMVLESNFMPVLSIGVNS